MAMKRKYRVVKNKKSDPHNERGFTHRKVFEGGGFLYLHRDHVKYLKRAKQKSKRA